MESFPKYYNFIWEQQSKDPFEETCSLQYPKLIYGFQKEKIFYFVHQWKKSQF